MRLRLFLLALLAALIFGSCNRHKTGATHVGGTISGAAGQKMLLQELGPEGSANLDSLRLDTRGNFAFRILSAETGLYMLRLPGLSALVLEVSPGDSVNTTASLISWPADAVITGSPASCDFQAFLKASALNKAGFDSLENILVSRQDDPDFAALTQQLDEAMKPLWDRQRALEITYLDAHPSSLTSLLVLNHGLSISPVLNFEEDSLYFLKLDTSLGKAFPGNKHCEFHHKRIIQARESKRAGRGSR